MQHYEKFRTELRLPDNYRPTLSWSEKSEKFDEVFNLDFEDDRQRDDFREKLQSLRSSWIVRRSIVPIRFGSSSELDFRKESLLLIETLHTLVKGRRGILYHLCYRCPPPIEEIAAPSAVKDGDQIIWFQKRQNQERTKLVKEINNYLFGKNFRLCPTPSGNQSSNKTVPRFGRLHTWRHSSAAAKRLSIPIAPRPEVAPFVPPKDFGLFQRISLTHDSTYGQPRR